MSCQLLSLNLICLLAVVGCSGCSGAGNAGVGGEPNPPVGLCIHQFASPVLAISSASDARTGTAFARVTLDQFLIDGVSVSAASLALVSSNVVVDGSALQCSLPCAFGTTEGGYTFVVSASGYKPADLSVAARYANFTGGCPSSNSGSTRTSVALMPL